MPKELWNRMQHKVARPVVEVMAFDSRELTAESLIDPAAAKDVPHVLPVAGIDPLNGSHRCPFLTYDLKCNIYADRPFVCREFGSESHLMMKCCFQDKDGRVRSRQETRAVTRAQCKGGHALHSQIMHDSKGSLRLLNVSVAE